MRYPFPWHIVVSQTNYGVYVYANNGAEIPMAALSLAEAEDICCRVNAPVATLKFALPLVREATAEGKGHESPL